jgi:hypothetical protein
MANKTRTRNISITVSDEELGLFQELARERDMPITQMVRGWMKAELAKSAKKTA